ncbi:MAG TPA: alpha/beta hydrolase [Acidimicrobiales bacterium]|nr:alpha/beta hydrolase [Acidimicrobiales bacterium]
MTTTLTHGRIALALHQLRDGDGRALLLLHELGGASPSTVPDEVVAWPGPVHALDFSGHGASGLARGGGYHPEILMADADAAIAHLGEATVVGWGLGGYVALMLAGGRPEAVRGAVIADGRGLAGVAEPGPLQAAPPGPPATTTPDPLAIVEMENDLRPPEYAVMFVDLATHGSGLDAPISVTATERPPWLEAVLAAPGVTVAPSIGEALARYAG